MYKSLSPSAFGVTGRLSELIELALTYGFRSIEVDIEDLLKKAEKQGIEHAARFVTSAQLKLGSFELPLDWRGEEGIYKAGLHGLDELAAGLVNAGARVCHATIEPASDTLPYHENFELHRRRLSEIGQVLNNHKLDLGVYLIAAPARRADRQFQFIHDAEALTTLIKSVGEDSIGLYLDTWNWHFGGGTAEQLQSLGQKIFAVSFADAAAEVTAETVTEEQRVLPSEEGVVDNLGYFKVLVEAGCKGPATVVPHGSVFAGKTRESIVQTCNAILDDFWKQAEVVKAPPELSEA